MHQLLSMPKRSFLLWIAQLGVLGKSPFAPATVATAVVGVPAAWLLGFAGRPLAWLVLALVVVLGCTASQRAEEELGQDDPQVVVIDEIAGFLVTMIGFPVSFASLFWGFAAFRLFDIWKPWPIGMLHHRLKGGVAVVMDDVGAGMYAHLFVWLILRLSE